MGIYMQCNHQCTNLNLQRHTLHGHFKPVIIKRSGGCARVARVACGFSWASVEILCFKSGTCRDLAWCNTSVCAAVLVLDIICAIKRICQTYSARAPCNAVSDPHLLIENKGSFFQSRSFAAKTQRSRQLVRLVCTNSCMSNACSCAVHGCRMW